MYKFHKKKSVDIDVDLIRVGLLSVPSSGNGGKGSEESHGSHGNGAPSEKLTTDFDDFESSPNDSEAEVEE